MLEVFGSGVEVGWFSLFRGMLIAARERRPIDRSFILDGTTLMWRNLIMFRANGTEIGIDDA